MRNLTITFFCIIAFVCSNKLPRGMLGGWEKSSLDINSAELNSCMSVMHSKLNELGFSTVYPLDVYTQLVNGINYLFVSAVEKTTGVYGMYELVVYTGPFGRSFEEKPTASHIQELEPIEEHLTTLATTEILKTELFRKGKIEKITLFGKGEKISDEQVIYGMATINKNTQTKTFFFSYAHEESVLLKVLN